MMYEIVQKTNGIVPKRVIMPAQIAANAKLPGSMRRMVTKNVIMRARMQFHFLTYT